MGWLVNGQALKLHAQDLGNHLRPGARRWSEEPGKEGAASEGAQPGKGHSFACLTPGDHCCVQARQPVAGAGCWRVPYWRVVQPRPAGFEMAGACDQRRGSGIPLSEGTPAGAMEATGAAACLGSGPCQAEAPA